MNNPKWPFLILVNYATRGRPERFFGGMESIYNNCAQPDYMKVIITADTNDGSMNNDYVREQISKYQNAQIIYGESKNKIDAINKNIYAWKGWDIIVNFSDDQRFTMYGWDDLIRVDFNNVFPETLDGYVAYRDPDTNGALATMMVAGRKYIDRFGFVYDPQFVSLFCDNLMEDCAKHLGKYHYTGYDIYRHFNSAYGYSDFPPDAMFEEQQRIGWDVDNKLYYKLKEEGIENYLKKFNL